jgi:hypothetical protein
MTGMYKSYAEDRVRWGEKEHRRRERKERRERGREGEESGP